MWGILGGIKNVRDCLNVILFLLFDEKLLIKYYIKKLMLFQLNKSCLLYK